MRHSKDNMAFTLVELMVATTILLIICMILLSLIQMISNTWTSTTGKIEQFREAREGFESITRRLSQATLNTYWDYQRDSSGNPTMYIRQSELRFISGPALLPLVRGNGIASGYHAVFFQAPLGYATNTAAVNLSNLLNTWGYYIKLVNDSGFWPSFITSGAQTRFRLMEMSEPSDALTLYQYTSGTNSSGDAKNSSYTGHDWYITPFALKNSSGTPTYSRVLAKNIIALVILPKFANGEKRSNGNLFTDGELAPAYAYDTHAYADANVPVVDPEINPRNQLPPVIQVTMVAIDEGSAKRMSAIVQNNLQTKVSGLFQTVGSTTDATQPGYAKDLKDLQDYLVANKINFRVFTTSVSLKSAKWSRSQ